jgi:tetratricopeptide (TPR) repeat protein
MAFLQTSETDLEQKLAECGYWVALANRAVEEKQYTRAIELCRQHLADEPHLVGPRAIYARALFASGQHEAAADQCHLTLAIDPDNEVILKLLGDILLLQTRETEGLACYQRILELNPHCTGLFCALKTAPKSNERFVTIVRGEEIAEREKKPQSPVIYFTETIGDLYLTQGHPRMAVEVFRKLLLQTDTPRLRQKLTLAEDRISNKEEKNVSSTN